MKKIRPLRGYALIKIDESEEISAGGIIIPDVAKEKPSEGIIIALASDAIAELTVGDKVIFKKYSGVEVKNDNQELLLVPDSDILAKIVEVEEV
jgi:chaperonin GroES